MKLSFFAAALIGLISQTQAVTLEGTDYDFADYELAEIEEDADYENYDLAQLYDDVDEDDYLFGETEEESDSDFDLAETDDESDYDFAQINSEGDECSACSAAKATACNTCGAPRADNNIVLSVQAPECSAPKEEKKEPFEKAMLGALNELGNKSNQLATALDMQFKKNAKLAESKTMSVSGAISITPAAAAK